MMSDTPKGKVYIVGAGPGDPGLFTLRGKELLEIADNVMYDSLVNDALLEFAPQAEHVFVGKRAGNHSHMQDDINRLLVELANEGHTVVRLKGGDPTVFGRIGEELTALNDANIEYEIVPGITAGIAGPAYAGIPVTDRKLSSSVNFITGREAAESASNERLARLGTLVIYMGMKTMDEMVSRILESGRDGNTPVAVVQWATHPEQRTVTGTLKTIIDTCSSENIGSPAIIVVGEVVTLRGDYNWFENNL
jgi:uroporphyrinogen III methyltransferase / synthase